MSKSGSLYIERESLFHGLDGSIKLLMLIAWTGFAFAFMDVRVFLGMVLVGLGILKLSKLPAKAIWPLFAFIFVFTLFNSVFLLLITPEYGSKLTGSYTGILRLGFYSITLETIFYCITLSLKYIAIMPITILFIFTTHPSNFASSLNRIGVPYRVAYAVNIALRYIPDVKTEVDNIINAQEARGVAFRKGDAGLATRLKNYATVMVPLLLSSFNRIEVVSNAMDLRGFGKNKKRTWYHRKNYTGMDLAFAALSFAVLAAGVAIKITVGAVYWYPF
ncbi:energy-coupling factor transporter transmembrane protein EcfT [Anoxybacterium hadale]|uniref:Energy-coupling factor transporter transmembrane protein EcfT n=1 Tax=Anoxybacterium hadale TaxID=3408580 RepID=A0ACD1AFC4_9FIRM|nr:energy-coupling factor transporter transmembrane protein EcfT [Clostridiales bacterium]